MLYKVGDKVRVKPLEELRKSEFVVEEMLYYAGQIVTITETYIPTNGFIGDRRSCYSIKEDREKWVWYSECFAGLAEEPFMREECSEEDTIKWQKANPNLPDTKKWSTYPLKVDGEQLLRARELIESEFSIPSEPRPLVEVLKDKVSELETRVSELERKLEQVIRDV